MAKQLKKFLGMTAGINGFSVSDKMLLLVAILSVSCSEAALLTASAARGFACGGLPPQPLPR